MIEEIIPTEPADEIKITDIELGKNGTMILYANEQKKFVYSSYDPHEPEW